MLVNVKVGGPISSFSNSLLYASTVLRSSYMPYLVCLICLTSFVLYALLRPSYMPSPIHLICLTLFVLYAFPHSSCLPYLNFYAFRCLPPMPYLVLLGCVGSCLNVESRKCNHVLTHDFVTNRSVYRISITTILRQGRSL